MELVLVQLCCSIVAVQLLLVQATWKGDRIIQQERQKHTYVPTTYYYTERIHVRPEHERARGTSTVSLNEHVRLWTIKCVSRIGWLILCAISAVSGRQAGRQAEALQELQQGRPSRLHESGRKDRLAANCVQSDRQAGRGSVRTSELGPTTVGRRTATLVLNRP